MDKIIAITGKARSGKSTAASILAKELDYKTYAIASLVKFYVNKIFGFDERHSEGILKEEEQFTRVFTKDEIEVYIIDLLQKHPLYEEFDLVFAVNSFNSIFSDYINYSRYGNTQLKISPRKSYQLFGTDWCRSFIDENFWVDLSPTEKVIWTDCRFVNEAMRVRDEGGCVIKIVNPKQKQIPDSGHESEIDIPDALVDFVVENPMTKKGLKSNLLEIFY